MRLRSVASRKGRDWAELLGGTGGGAYNEENEQESRCGVNNGAWKKQARIATKVALPSEGLPDAKPGLAGVRSRNPNFNLTAFCIRPVN